MRHKQTVLEQTKQTLNDLNAFSSELPPIVDLVVKSIPINNIPDKMKLIIAVSEIVSFASQFRRNIWHWDGFELPVNATSFVIAGSGAGKDSAVKAARRCFALANGIITDARKELAKKEAISLASEAGETPPYEFEKYKKFYVTPPPALIAPTTPQGLIQHLNDIALLPLAAGTIYAGELGDELATNANMLEIIKIIAEVFDTGDKEVVYTKGKEFRSKEISAMPLNALLVGSPKYILFDYAVRKKFLIAFESKLARRSFFCYAPKPSPKVDNVPLADLLREERELTAFAASYKEKVSAGVMQVANYNIRKQNEVLQVQDNVQDLFNIYKLYNDRLSDTISHKYPLSKLVRQHLQWKALKLSGAFAILEESDVITQEHYLSAIRFCEALDSDMMLFEQDLVKEQYEVFSDYMQNNCENGELFLSLHELRKSGHIATQGSHLAKMKELTHLASSYDQNGIYTYNDSGITYKAVIKIDELSLSYKPVDNSRIEKAVLEDADPAIISKEKTFVAASATSGFSPVSVTFADLTNLLIDDNAYSPFLFEGNTRGADNIISGTKFVVLDIDKSDITFEEAHYILQDINHHIAQTSDVRNPFKFRILLELDSIVDVTSQVWKHFYLSIAKSLALNADPLPQSQVFFSYKNRPILSVIDKSPISVRDHLMLAYDKVNEKTVTERPLTSPQKKALLDDELTTFSYAFECVDNGSLNLIRAAKHARDLGMTNEDIIELIHRINEYWIYPLDATRLQNTIISQINRW